MQMENKIEKGYVEWANTLDSAGQDSTEVRARVNSLVVARIGDALLGAIKAASRVDEIKKHLFYGRELGQTPQGSGFMGHEVQLLQDHETIRLLHGIMGKIDEAGELAQIIYDYLFLGKPIDMGNLIEEVGDSQWYDALIAKYCGTNSFAVFMIANYNKLSARYGKTWTAEGANNRDLDREKVILDDVARGLMSKEVAEEQMGQATFNPDHIFTHHTLMDIVKTLRMWNARDKIGRGLEHLPAFQDLEQLAHAAEQTHLAGLEELTKMPSEKEFREMSRDEYDKRTQGTFEKLRDAQDDPDGTESPVG